MCSPPQNAMTTGIVAVARFAATIAAWTHCDDDVDPASDQFSGEFWQPVEIVLGRTDLDLTVCPST